MNLNTLLRGEVISEEIGMPERLKEAGMPASGLERLAGVIAAMASKLLEFLVPLYGSDSEEGKRIMRAIRTLSPLTKGIKAEDIGAILKVVETLITPTSLSPEQLTYLRTLTARTPLATETPASTPASPAAIISPPTSSIAGTEAGVGAGLEEILRK